MKLKTISLLMLLCYQGNAMADSLSLNTFLEDVKEKNIGYLAEKFQVDIAQARAKAARVFSDPSLSFGYSDNQDSKMKMGKSYEMELSYTLELGGKRSARMRVAQGEAELSKVLVEDYFNRLKAEASLAYFKFSKEQLTKNLYADYYQQICVIASHDSLRHAVGDIMETDAKQSLVERELAQINFMQKEMEWKQLQAELESYQGQAINQPVESMENYIQQHVLSLSLADALKMSEEHRLDIRIAMQTKKLSEYNLRLAKASRAMDLDLSVGAAHNTAANNLDAPSPSHNSFSAGIGIPLQFSRLNRGEIQAFELERQQQALAVDAIVLQVRKETTQAFLAFESAEKQLNQFRNAILKPSQEILDKKTYSYKRGEISWLEWVNAQHAYQETKAQYYETLYNYMASRIELQLATGKSQL